MAARIYVRAADIGGSGKVTRGDVDVTTGEMSNLQVSPNPITTADEFVDYATKDLDPRIRGVAHSIAGVNEDNDEMKVSPNLHALEGYKIATMTRGKSGLYAFVFNDMATTAGGVHLLRQAINLPPGAPFFVWTIGSGIGGKYAIVVNGQLIILDSEIGHMIISDSIFAPFCGCLVKGHAEGIASGDSAARLVKTYLDLAGMKLPDGMAPCAYLDECFDRGEDWAIMIYQTIAKALALLINNIRCAYSFKHFIYKGTAGTNWFKRGMGEMIRKELKQVLVNKAWASEENLQFIETPGPNNVDALIGAAWHLAVKAKLI